MEISGINIPPEVLKLILIKVDKPSLVMVCQVNKLWNYYGKKVTSKIRNTIDVYDAYFNNDILALIGLFAKCGFSPSIDYRYLSYVIHDAYYEYKHHDYGVGGETWCVTESNIMRSSLDKECKWKLCKIQTEPKDLDNTSAYNQTSTEPTFHGKYRSENLNIDRLYDTSYILNNNVIFIDFVSSKKPLSDHILIKEYNEKVTILQYISDDERSESERSESERSEGYDDEYGVEDEYSDEDEDVMSIEDMVEGMYTWSHDDSSELDSDENDLELFRNCA